MADLTVYVTLLPTGAPAGKLNFSALLTPALDDSAALPDLFKNWPKTAAPLTAAWDVQLSQGGVVVGEGRSAPISPPSIQELWTKLIDASTSVNKRKGKGRFKGAWLLSHDSHYLQARHKKLRTHHAFKHLLAARNIQDQPTTQALDASIDSLAPRNVYIYPVVQQSAAVSMQTILTDRKIALALEASNFSGSDPALRRIHHGKTRLESEEGEQLTGLALMALYRHCVQSLLRPDNDPQAATVNPALRTLTDKIDARAATLASYDKTLYPQVQKYVEFHLFKNRKHEMCMPPPPPDFHQLLGLLHQYPAMLRSLGLAYDFAAVTLDHALTSIAGPVLASVIAPKIAGIRFVPLQTVCTTASDFIAASRNARHTGRFLNLMRDAPAAPKFSLVTEDNDGSSNKLAQHAAAVARSSEYQSAASVGNSSLGPGDPAQSVPSARTAGIALYCVDRAELLAEAIQNTPDPNQSPMPPLYIEDITLGYRADVKVASNATWMSLHERASKYEISGLNKPWEPGGTELAADEGYITLAGTHSPVDSTAADSSDADQIQVHQSLIVWTGWSLSVPRLGSEDPKNTMNGAPAKTCASGPKTNIKATYKLKAGRKLPRLQFDETYALRLRHVDLCGNSVPVTAPDAVGGVLTQDAPFSRHEPIRAPQILLENEIERDNQPSEHVDRMVIRDNGAWTTRVLVPPREPLRMAELHDIADTSKVPQSAFTDRYLLNNGAFPSVVDAHRYGWIDSDVSNTAENQDALFLKAKGASEPKNGFYPDPLARLVRVEPFALQEDLYTFTPWLDDADVIRSGVSKKMDVGPAFYLDFLPRLKWPFASPVRLRVEGVSADKPLNIRQEMVSEDGYSLPTIATLIVELPEGCTVALRLTSAWANAAPAAPKLPLLDDIGAKVASIIAIDHPPPEPVVETRGTSVNLFHACKQEIGTAKKPDGIFAQLAEVAAPAALFGGPATPPPDPLSQKLQQLLGNVSPDAFVSGTLHPVTPPRIMTLVHALKQPLTAPDFSGDKQGSGFQVVRASQTTAASVTTQFIAHWQSTAKIACTATWTDKIDDPTKPGLTDASHNEVAFEFLNKGMEELPADKSKPHGRAVAAQHLFRDTRAHSVQYSLSAFSRFREYYPEKSKPADFQKPGERACTVQVLSSVRPPVPSLAYIIPAFAWQDVWDARTKTWMRGRTMVLRAYLQRPFLVSGDEECIGVVLSGAATGVQTPVTQWGADPILPAGGGLPTNLMTAANFGPSQLAPNCHLAEGGVADVLPFPVEFSPERGLWFCDIPLSSSRTASAFARLALVRWQPKALVSANDDARLSQVVLADFMQIGPDRWVCVKKLSATEVSVTISGVFRTPKATPVELKEHTISCSIEQRWHRLGSDLGWRPACPGPAFSYSAPSAGSNISCWSAKVKLPHSSTFYKFRLLLEEHEWLAADASKRNDVTLPLTRKSRTTYLHYIEL